MLVELHLLTGFMIGFEYVSDFEDAHHLVVDLGIARLLLTFPKDSE
jgi:hypothetical protein